MVTIVTLYIGNTAEYLIGVLDGEPTAEAKQRIADKYEAVLNETVDWYSEDADDVRSVGFLVMEPTDEKNLVLQDIL